MIYSEIEMSDRKKKKRDQDFLDEVVSERSKREPRFPAMVESALDRRRLLRHLAYRRERLGLTQVTVAGRMGTSQSAVARIEAGEIDAKLSTVERYAAAIGQHIEWRVSTVPPGSQAGTRSRLAPAVLPEGPISGRRPHVPG